jgi:ABC-type Fe3+/spermidine/putrescine transport system ATPase subunit
LARVPRRSHFLLQFLVSTQRKWPVVPGRIEQEGTPEAIYGAPDSLFCAEFMGNNNRFPGKVAEIRGDLAKVEGEGVRRLKKWHIRVPNFKVQVLGFGVGFPGILTCLSGSAKVAL